MFFMNEPLGNYELINKLKEAIYKDLEVYQDIMGLVIAGFNEEVIEIIGAGISDKKTKFRVKAIVKERTKSVHITNIIVSDEISNKGIGKKIIHEIYKVSKENGYRLFMVTLMPGFYKRLIKRGAIKTNIDDMLEITENTRLID